MKLYYSKGACSLTVHIVIREIGLSCEYESVNLRTKITASGVDYLTINPKGAVSAFVTDDNEVLTENAVIMQYLADKYKAINLLPALGDFKRYRVLEWLNFITTDIHKTFGPLFSSKVPDTLKVDLFGAQIKNKIAIANQALEKNQYLLGGEFTLPDAYLFVMLTWLGHAKIDIKEFPNLDRYFEMLKGRKSIVEAMGEEV